MGEAAGPYRLVLEETVVWTFPPLPYQLPSHRVFATFVLLTVFTIILCGLIVAFVCQRHPQEEGLLENPDEDTHSEQSGSQELSVVSSHSQAHGEAKGEEKKEDG